MRERIRVLDALFNGLQRSGHIPGELRDYWTLMKNIIQRDAEKRNELAHFSIKHDMFSEPPRFVVLPYHSEAQYKLSPFDKEAKQKPKIEALEIRRRAFKFGQIALELSWLSGELGVVTGLYSANPSQEFRRPQSTNTQTNPKTKQQPQS